MQLNYSLDICKVDLDPITTQIAYNLEDSLFSIKWKYKRPYMKQDDEEESTIKLLANISSNDPFIKIITNNVLYYIFGYIVKKIIPVLQCPNDIKALFNVSNNTNDHDY
uniref:Uncharacterized protein n=1 Tax=Sipha flava TaxID=143950 RepID=A0A2S2Q4F1_9HEMI